MKDLNDGFPSMSKHGFFHLKLVSAVLTFICFVLPLCHLSFSFQLLLLWKHVSCILFPKRNLQRELYSSTSLTLFLYLVIRSKSLPARLCFCNTYLYFCQRQISVWLKQMIQGSQSQLVYKRGIASSHSFNLPLGYAQKEEGI